MVQLQLNLWIKGAMGANTNALLEGQEIRWQNRSKSQFKVSYELLHNIWINNFIIGAPVIESFSFPKFLEEGSRAKILCSVIKGDPPMTIRWLKDGRVLGSVLSTNNMPTSASSSSSALPSMNGISISTLDEFSSAIILSKVSLSHHRGNYTCIASNSVSSTNYTAEALVHGKFYQRFTISDHLRTEEEILSNNFYAV